MKELFDFMIGASVVSDDTSLVSVDGKVAALTFEKDGVKKTIAFCGNDFGRWIKEIHLTPIEYNSFEEWEAAVLRTYFMGNLIDARTFNHDGSIHSFKGTFPDRFANINEPELKAAVEDYILRDPEEEYVADEEDNAYLELSDKIDKLYEDCYTALETTIAPGRQAAIAPEHQVVIANDIGSGYGSFIVKIHGYKTTWPAEDIDLPEGFVLDSSSASLILKVSHKELNEISNKLYKPQ